MPINTRSFKSHWFWSRKAKLSGAEVKLEQARTYTDESDFDCPLCEIKHGQILRLCSMHKQIATLENKLAKWGNLEQEDVAELVELCNEVSKNTDRLLTWIPPMSFAEKEAMNACGKLNKSLDQMRTMCRIIGDKLKGV